MSPDLAQHLEKGSEQQNVERASVQNRSVKTVALCQFRTARLQAAFQKGTLRPSSSARASLGFRLRGSSPKRNTDSVAVVARAATHRNITLHPCTHLPKDAHIAIDM
jgi:hypothetical protein